MVVVMPLGYGDMAVVGKRPSDDGLSPALPPTILCLEMLLLTEIVPHVEAEYRVVKTRDGKAITGLSMGASQSLDIGLNAPAGTATGEFAWIGGFSAPALFVQRPAVGGQTSKLRLLWISCGTGGSAA